MSLETDISAVTSSWRIGRVAWPELKLRLICVLQKGGIDSTRAISAYLNWATSLGISEICFKELYVSTSIESYYHRHAANEWSHENQVPLSIVLDFASANNLSEVGRLPWGAPIFKGELNGKPLQIAAYTEPSLLWERCHKMARSWNLMADGRCLVSLEDRSSEIELTLPA